MATSPEIKKALHDMARARDALEREAVLAENKILAAFKRAEARTYTRMAEIIAEAPDLKALSFDKRMAWYVENAASLEQAVQGSGYSEAVEAYIAKYEDYAKFAGQMLEAGRVPSEFTKIPRDLLELWTNRERLYFEELNSRGLAELDKIFLEQAVGGRTRGAMLGELKGMITGSYPWGERRGLYEWHAGTYVRTAHFRAAQVFHNEQAKRAGVKSFIYVGPLDGKTRPFCQENFGQIYTEEEIGELDNGQSGDVFTDRGGFNCRHSWNGISEELALEMKELEELAV